MGPAASISLVDTPSVSVLRYPPLSGDGFVDNKLLSVERLIGLTMIIMGFLNVLLSIEHDLDIMPVIIFLSGIVLFIHSSVETWHKWGVIILVIAAGVVFKVYEVDPLVTYWYKMILFYGTILTVIVFMLTHRVKSSS